jgi:hypothetical protein
MNLATAYQKNIREVFCPTIRRPSELPFGRGRLVFLGVGVGSMEMVSAGGCWVSGAGELPTVG